jgi:hypothetical protein
MKKYFIEKRKVLLKFIVMFRFWLLKKMFTQDEKYLIIRAIEDRVDNLERVAINEKWADKDNIRVDCAEYSRLKTIFFNNGLG